MTECGDDGEKFFDGLTLPLVIHQNLGTPVANHAGEIELQTGISWRRRRRYLLIGCCCVVVDGNFSFTRWAVVIAVILTEKRSVVVQFGVPRCGFFFPFSFNT